ncbi:tetratricopeptide repeat protein [Gramella sp. Hel_I_59]|uniref:tetratricopeptide repeat protein n=1 Tax=Gramella sp. Hel_I_59 TaxID=1249978 RepID=UPI00163B5D91|nr:tetratricopeptide repeat protein [Gramella sp. Hel_I_59]
MKYYKRIFLLTFTIITLFSCKKADNKKNTKDEVPISNFSAKQQDSLKDLYVKNKAKNFPLYSQERQAAIDEGLKVDSTIAYFWQQKAMPLFKQRKYEIGMDFIDEAVKYDRKRYQDYRAFIKCIFSKQYREAIADFKDYQEEFGYGFVMDHSYDFYIALSYLQLNEFEKAEKLFEKDYKRTIEKDGRGWLHHLDLFYYGISKYEQKKNKQALDLFNQALDIYPQFSDVQYYKAVTLLKLGEKEEATKVYQEAIKNADKGYTINEDNAIYEIYPYQMRW